ncbi:MAG: hypothetical protein N2045_07115 [Fimbriimonadales bacterium]|jgi:hypothetical protein|nr:hypothetical protein [Fimbriimonadales bacterium]GBC89725.1 hypothetical protein HRbin14_00453 [bacterium HR14]GIV11974.1 MAG: hypothetical protein KatS3mg021_0256 [Fimbriimonadales bacterium]CUU02307.1 hypothetical protein GBSOP10_10178 [Armatimonadetes bacterium GBS]CUU34244.1 hypothetical protein GXSOP10_11318 [Armatimonadetes bacterium GXS]
MSQPVPYTETPSVAIERAGRFMKFRWQFHTPQPLETVRQRLQEYFQRLGYETVSDEPTMLVLKRGLLVRSALNYAPRQLAVELRIALNPAPNGTEVALNLQLNRTGHTIYEIERLLLIQELTESARYVAGESVDFTRMDYLNRETRVRYFVALLLAGAIAFFLAIPVFLFVRPILAGWGIESPWRGAILGGIIGAIFGGLAWLFLALMLKPQKF